MTDTARFADVVLPGHARRSSSSTWYRRGATSTSAGTSRPSRRSGRAVPNTELWRRLARPWASPTPSSYLERRGAADIGAAGRGRRAAPQAGLRPPRPARTTSARTPRAASRPRAGRAELLERGARPAQGHDPLPDLHPGDRGARAATRELPAKYPLALLTPKTHTRFLNTSYSHLPKHGPLEGGPLRGARRGRRLGARHRRRRTVRVWNDRGALTLHGPALQAGAPRCRRRAVRLVERPARRRGHANSLTNDTLTDWGGGVAFGDTLVQVAPLTTRPAPDRARLTHGFLALDEPPRQVSQAAASSSLRCAHSSTVMA